MTHQALKLMCLIILVSTKGVSQNSETPETKLKRHTIGIHYPNHYFFDRAGFQFSRFKLGAFGFSYQHYNPIKKRSVSIYYEHYFSGWYNTENAGDIWIRNVNFFSFRYSKPVIQKRIFSLLWFSEFNHRLGDEHYYLGFYYNGWEKKFERHLMIDFGLSLGIEIKFSLPFGITPYAGIKQSFYYFRYDRGSDYWVFEDGSPRSVLNFNVGLGWSFRKAKKGN
ncbi:MAG: hypothetical protein IPM77_09725 [Crocinitomicaceae bacterium]|nr:hypothetical protein [Crocinitomicaceae bacterium]